MPLQNRVTPLGDLVAHPARGLVYGNRGCLHDEQGRIRRRYNGKRWIACRLEFRGWQRSPLMQPGRFTELFFLDEATAFAAGHRPCALCRREDYVRFLEIIGCGGADAVDARLHDERRRHPHAAAFAGLPDGAFVLVDTEPLAREGRQPAALDSGRLRRSRPAAARAGRAADAADAGLSARARLGPGRPAASSFGRSAAQYHLPRAKPPKAINPMRAMIKPSQKLQKIIARTPMITMMPPTPIPRTPPSRAMSSSFR
jgi:hypothetical protein